MTAQEQTDKAARKKKEEKRAKAEKRLEWLGFTILAFTVFSAFFLVLVIVFVADEDHIGQTAILIGAAALINIGLLTAYLVSRKQAKKSREVPPPDLSKCSASDRAKKRDRAAIDSISRPPGATRLNARP